MSHKRLSPTDLQREWIGDAALRMLVCLVLSERYPDEYPVALKGRVDVYVQNSFLTRFCRTKGFNYGCNGFERHLGQLIGTKFEYCKYLVNELIDYGQKVNAERTFKAKMERFNLTRCSVKPVPCMCGSLNLNLWKRPAKIVCRDCKREFVPVEKVKNTTETIEAWNLWRSLQRAPQAEYSG